MRKVDTLILGAGISGLTYAAFTGEDYLILEKEGEAGGLCRTFYKNGFVWDYSGHFFHFSNPKIRSFFENVIQEEDMVRCKKKTNIFLKGNSINYPFQMNIHQLPKDKFIDCLYDLFNRNEKEKYNDFQDMLYGKFGKSITDMFLKPYNEKLYACSLNSLDVDAMGRFFPYADPIQIINNMKNDCVDTYNSTFDYPKKGAKFFVDVLLQKVELCRLMLNCTVQRIDLENKTVYYSKDNFREKDQPNHLDSCDNEQIKYKKLISTIPLKHFIKMIPEENLDLYEHELSCNKILVFNLGFDRGKMNSDLHWTYFPDRSVCFYRVGYYNNILGEDRLSLYVELGYKENEKIDIDSQLNKVLMDLNKVGIINEHKLIAYNSLVINPGYVHITKNSIKKIEELGKKLLSNDAYTIGRYGKWTYCSIEDCMIQALELINN